MTKMRRYAFWKGTIDASTRLPVVGSQRSARTPQLCQMTHLMPLLLQADQTWKNVNQVGDRKSVV